MLNFGLVFLHGGTPGTLQSMLQGYLRPLTPFSSLITEPHPQSLCSQLVALRGIAVSTLPSQPRRGLWRFPL